MLPQTVKLFRFMNINAHPAKGGGGSSVGRGWRGQRSHHKRAAWEYRTQRRLQLQPQLHSKHGAIVAVVVVVVLAVIDSRTSLAPQPLASCLLLLLLQLISSDCAAVGCAFCCCCCRFAFFIRSLPNLSIN